MLYVAKNGHCVDVSGAGQFDSGNGTARRQTYYINKSEPDLAALIMRRGVSVGVCDSEWDGSQERK